MTKTGWVIFPKNSGEDSGVARNAQKNRPFESDCRATERGMETEAVDGLVEVAIHVRNADNVEYDCIFSAFSC